MVFISQLTDPIRSTNTLGDRCYLQKLYRSFKFRSDLQRIVHTLECPCRHYFFCPRRFNNWRSYGHQAKLATAKLSLVEGLTHSPCTSQTYRLEACDKLRHGHERREHTTFAKCTLRDMYTLRDARAPFGMHGHPQRCTRSLRYARALSEVHAHTQRCTHTLRYACAPIEMHAHSQSSTHTLRDARTHSEMHAHP